MTTKSKTVKGKSTSTSTARVRAPRATFGQELQTDASDSVSRIKYDSNREVLRVEFRADEYANKAYDYQNVSGYEVSDLIGSKSLGKAMADIKNSHAVKKVRGGF